MSESWLKSLENGHLGEARAYSLLAQRFWVLRRSVDLDGVDLIVQRRDRRRRFTDELPLRFAIVQVKFSSTPKTEHHIRKSYIQDSEGLPLKGFFILLHCGFEDSKEAYLLSADDASKRLPEGIRDGVEGYILKAGSLSQEFKIMSEERALNQIEDSINKRISEDTEKLLRSINVPEFEIAAEQVDTSWLVPLPIEFNLGNIQESFHHRKMDVRRLLSEMEDILSEIGTALTSISPREFLDRLLAIEDDESIVQINERRYIAFGSQEMMTAAEYFRSAVSAYERRLERLDRDGARDDYTSTFRIIEAECVKAFRKSIEKTQDWELDQTKQNYLIAELRYRFAAKERGFAVDSIETTLSLFDEGTESSREPRPADVVIVKQSLRVEGKLFEDRLERLFQILALRGIYECYNRLFPVDAVLQPWLPKEF